MKIIVFTILLTLCSNAYSYDCKKMNNTDGTKLSIERDKDPTVDMYHIRLPKTLKNKKLNSLILSAKQNINGQPKEISVPLLIRSKGKITGSYFYLSPNWLNITATATYGNEKCLELITELNI